MTDQCDQCGICCKLFFINLNEEEYRSGDYRTMNQVFGLIDDFKDAELCGANILETKEDNACIYLKGNECSIHNDRPEACRDFFCRSKDPKWKRMVDMINEVKVEKLNAIYGFEHTRVPKDLTYSEIGEAFKHGLILPLMEEY